MVGHGGIVAFEEPTDMRAVATHLLHFGAAESCGKCFPCRIGLQRAHAMFDERRAGRPRASSKQLLETLELGSLCAHGGGMPAPIRSLLAHFPEELGLAVITLDDRRRRTSRSPPGTTVLDAARAAGAGSRRCASTSARRRSAPAACAWSASRARPGPVASCTTPCRDGHGGRHAGRDRPPRRRPRSSSSCSPSCPSRPAEHTELAQVARDARRRRAALARRDAHDARTTSATRTSPSSTSCASRAGAACARATRSRARSR